MNKNKKDYLTRTLIFQFIFSLLLFLFLYLINYCNLPFLKELKNDFFSELKNSVTQKEAETAFKNFYSENSNFEFIFTDYNEEKISATILGEGGEDVKINGEKIPSVSNSKYKINFNIFNPVINGEISSEFGTRIHPITNDYSFHKGIDIAANENENIYAAIDGTVIETGYDRWNGNYLKILHENGIMTVYCHCNKVLVKEKAVIRGGEVVALIGSTGQSTGPHLHFELRIDDVCFNPIYALNEAKNAV